jgi:hypothetical protein
MRFRATDRLGTVEDLYFDDDRWTIRYLVLRTGNWLISRAVLVSPMAIAHVGWDDARFDLRLTQDDRRRRKSAIDSWTASVDDR